MQVTCGICFDCKACRLCRARRTYEAVHAHVPHVDVVGSNIDVYVYMYMDVWDAPLCINPVLVDLWESIDVCGHIYAQMH